MEHECLICGRKMDEPHFMCDSCGNRMENVAYIKTGTADFLVHGIVNTNKKIIAMTEQMDRIEDKIDKLLAEV